MSDSDLNQAVEAAANAICSRARAINGRPPCESHRKQARAAIDAALPHLHVLRLTEEEQAIVEDTIRRRQ